MINFEITQIIVAMKKLYTIAFVIVCLGAISHNNAKAQLVVDTAVSVNTMMDDFFANTCVSISNITYSGAPVAVGFFDASGTNLGINAGFMMTSGSVYNAIGPNDNSAVTLHNNMNGDGDLDALAGYTTYDASIIEMDIIPSLDTLYFKYAFGSDEYTEWVGTGFNDVFAFYVSGPGITGEQNIAVVPGNNDPVSVNSINCVNANQAYYMCNTPFDCSGISDCPNTAGETTLQYDGLTIPITAQITVVPGETYHVKLAIADAGDGILDSGIFIGVESLCGDGQLKPIPGFTASVNDNEVQFYNQSRYATSFNWNFGDNTTSTEANPVHVYSEPGNYQVTLTVENYCCNSAVTEPVNIGTATAIQSLVSQPLQLFPNPTDGLLTIQTGSNKPGIVKLFNHAGVELTSYTIHSTATIDLSAYPKGMLFVQLIMDGQSYFKKVELK